MRAYLSIIRIRFLLLLQYRMAAIAGISTQFLFGFIRVMIFAAFFSSTTDAQPMTFGQTVTYIWLSQAFIRVLPWNRDRDIQEKIKSGNLAYEFCRPLDIYNQWLARAIAMKTAPTIMRAIPLFLIALCLPAQYRLSLPPDFLAVLTWLIAMVGAVLISSALTNIMNISTLWTISGDGINYLLPALVNILSGVIVPLPFFPDWLRGIVERLPFAGLIDIPMRFYSGHYPPIKIIPLFLQQIGWFLILVLIGKCLFYKGKKKVIIQGG